MCTRVLGGEEEARSWVLQGEMLKRWGQKEGGPHVLGGWSRRSHELPGGSGVEWASLHLLRGVPSGPVSRCLLSAGSLSETPSLCWGLLSKGCVGTSCSNAGDGTGSIRAASAPPASSRGGWGPRGGRWVSPHARPQGHAGVLGHTREQSPGISLGCHLLEDRVLILEPTLPAQREPGARKSPKRGVAGSPGLGGGGPAGGGDGLSLVWFSLVGISHWHLMAAQASQLCGSCTPRGPPPALCCGFRLCRGAAGLRALL